MLTNVLKGCLWAWVIAAALAKCALYRRHMRRWLPTASGMFRRGWYYGLFFWYSFAALLLLWTAICVVTHRWPF